MDFQRKKQIKKYVAWVCAVLLVFLLAVMPLLTSPEAKSDGPQASILSTRVEQREILEELLGGGLLAGDRMEELTIPAQVKLTEYLVGNGDVVAEGDPIAAVDRVSVMTAITQVQETVEELSADIEKERTKTADTAVTAQAGGTVKVLYAQPGDAVEDVMLEHGALAVLSLDNRIALAVSVQTELEAGDRVTVTPEGGDAVTGTVVSNLEGTLVVTVADKGYAIGTPAALARESGEVIGKGTLELYSPWHAVGYSGTVDSLAVREGQKVSAGQTLLRLKDTGSTARYHALIAQRQEYEALYQELFEMYHSGFITAPCSGIISGVDTSGAFLLEDDVASGAGQSMSASGSRRSVARLSQPSAGNETPLAILSGGLIDGTVGTPYSFTLTASQTGGTWTSTALAEGLTLAPDTGVISGTPTAAFAGNVTVYYILGEKAVSAEMTLRVEEIPPAYTGYAAKVTLVTEGYLEVLRGTASIPISDPDQLPQVTPADGELTEPGAYQIQISPQDVSVDDVVLLVFDDAGNLIKVARQSQPGGGEIPGQGNPGGQGSSIPDLGGLSGFGGISGFGSFGGFGGMGGAGGGQEEDTLYPLDTLTIAVVTSQEQMLLDIAVDEADILKLYEGQPAVLTVDALSGEQFDAVVHKISLTGVNSGGRTKFTVTVATDKHTNMYPGMSGAVRFALSEPRQVAAIPVAALVEDGTRVFVYTGYDPETGELLNPVEVTTGISDGEYVQVSGIPEGTEVFYAYYDTLEESFTPDSGIFG